MNLKEMAKAVAYGAYMASLHGDPLAVRTNLHAIMYFAARERGFCPRKSEESALDALQEFERLVDESNPDGRRVSSEKVPQRP